MAFPVWLKKAKVWLMAFVSGTIIQGEIETKPEEPR